MNHVEILTGLLDRNQIVRIVVLPCLCKGLHGYPPVQPLPLNLGWALKPDMNIQATETGIEFRATFQGEPRAVSVPWEALLFAGTIDQFQQLLAERAPKDPAPADLVTGRNGNVVHVDFQKKRA